MAYDVVVVGGGSAGCVLASRLSEDPGRRVLLVEAGPDHPAPADLPRDVVDASEPTLDHDWGYTADAELDRAVPLPRARIMGGCSATNACFALRGSPEVYDAWAASGNPGWSFTDILEDFRRLETDEDFADPWHGAEGPIAIGRTPRRHLNPVQAAFVDGCVEAGHRYVEDHNRPGATGAGPTPRNVRDGVRMSSALTYLARARPRRNLTIRPDTLVGRVELRGTRAVGIRLADETLLEADHVVLAAGSYASPMILARSGIGPEADLRRVGIDPVLDLPGVGSNLVDHPLASVDLPTRAILPGESRFQTHLSLHSRSSAGADTPDLLLALAGPFDLPDPPPEAGVFAIVCGLMTPLSRGWVRLTSTEPDAPPRIHPAHLADPADLERMVDALTEARRIAATAALAAVTTGPELQPGPACPPGDRDALAAWLRGSVSTFHHPVGTCAMGPDPQQGAVCDERGAVHGCQALTVGDASVMPTIPSANTNLPTIMVAERIARWLRDA